MESIARTILGWLWKHKVWTAIGTVSAAMGFYAEIVRTVNERLDTAILQAFREHATMGIQETALRVGKRVGRVESRLWALTRKGTLAYSQNFEGEFRFYLRR